MSYAIYFKPVFLEFTPNWYEWLSLFFSPVVSLLSILGGYKIATNIYTKEKKDKNVADKEIVSLEINLFRDNLVLLENTIEKQINKLNTYVDKKNFRLEINEALHADFLKFVNVKSLYVSVGLENKEKIQKINILLSRLYTLTDFRISLRDELRSYLKKYNYHESKFYLYRKLMYTKYFELCNHRTSDVSLNNGVKIFKFNEDDVFMKTYSSYLNRISQDNEVIGENGLKDRSKLINRFIIPLIQLSAEFIPEDYNAIEINDIGNEINSAFCDMEQLDKSHFTAIDSHLKSLEDIKSKILEFIK